MKTILGVIAFLALYGLADWAGTNMPPALGFIIMLGFFAGIIAAAVAFSRLLARHLDS